MRCVYSLLVLWIIPTANAQHNLTRLWETDSILVVPESVLYTEDFLYVSLVDGQELDDDGKGGIAKVGLDGKVMDAHWVTGLSGPKGMGLWNGKLYVANINEIAVIDTVNGKIESRIAIKGAVGLNDLAVDKTGTLYVSDSRLGIVYRIKKCKTEVYLEGLPGANGLKVIGEYLFILTGSDVYKVEPGKKLLSIGKSQNGADGLEYISNGEFIITIYNGLIYFLDHTGTKQLLLDTRSRNQSSADIAFNAKGRIIYVPTLFHKSVVAYELH